jgi:uncharacterized protein (TIGR03437 family)
VRVLPGAASASFTATAGMFSSDQAATVTATLSGVSQTASISLVAPATLSSVACTPTTLAPGAASTCTVTISKAASADGLTVTLASGNAALTVPGTVRVLPGAASASFTATAGMFSSDQAATVTATLSGVSQTASISLVAPATLSSITCTPASLASNVTATCTVTLSKAAPTGGSLVFVSESSALLTAPASVTVAAAASSATFTVTAGSTTSAQPVTITASLNGITQTAAITIQGATSTSGRVAAYGFNEGSGSKVYDVSGTGNNGTIWGASWTSIARYGKALLFNGWSSYVDFGKPAVLLTTGSMTWSAWIRPNSSQIDGQIVARSNGTAGWQLKMSRSTGRRTLAVSVSNGARMIERYSQTAITQNSWYYVAGVYNSTDRTLHIYVNGVLDDGVLSGTVPASQSVPDVTVTAGKRLGGDYFAGAIDELRIYNRALSLAEVQADMVTSTTTQLRTTQLPVLLLPATQVTKADQAVRFGVAAKDPADLPVEISSSSLPAGAAFDSSTGRFEWTPAISQTGTYELSFRATNAAQLSSTERVVIEVESGKPVVESDTVFCSPGSVADLTGRWLAESDALLSDPSGASLELSGVRVTVNGNYVPIVLASASGVKFVCPALEPGTPLSIVVENRLAASDPVVIAMHDVSPEILSVMADADTSLPFLSQQAGPVPATLRQRNGRIAIRVTGLGLEPQTLKDELQVRVGDTYAQVDSIQASPGYAGIFTVTVHLSGAVAMDSEVPIQVQLSTKRGGANSNVVMGGLGLARE